MKSNVAVSLLICFGFVAPAHSFCFGIRADPRATAERLTCPPVAMVAVSSRKELRHDRRPAVVPTRARHRTDSPRHRPALHGDKHDA
jgi:hypothetical protein